jgi:hypothetical protein
MMKMRNKNALGMYDINITLVSGIDVACKILNCLDELSPPGSAFSDS